MASFMVIIVKGDRRLAPLALTITHIRYSIDAMAKIQPLMAEHGYWAVTESDITHAATGPHLWQVATRRS